MRGTVMSKIVKNVLLVLICLGVVAIAIVCFNNYAKSTENKPSSSVQDTQKDDRPRGLNGLDDIADVKNAMEKVEKTLEESGASDDVKNSFSSFSEKLNDFFNTIPNLVEGITSVSEQNYPMGGK